MPRTPHADDRTAAAPAPGPVDPEPVEPAPAGRLCVPVRPGGHGVTARFSRTPVGARTAVAFTTPERLRATLGTEQPWIPLSEAALRTLAHPLGVHALTVDPVLTAPFTPAPDPVPEPVPLPAPTSTPARPGTPCARRSDPAARGTAA
ncbi:SAV_915 family protein [Streptomyces roseolus]|uniref:SAV_915 family protein n=1 Tax=Streptomyces roseolus TaxID=67358 RepID=UPI00167B4C3E|nr:SAV_915 family protein [Streptomyces roseolus]GGR57744.1 hypothetical protein GCM10010282_58480 [Streptomyces roseolus]